MRQLIELAELVGGFVIGDPHVNIKGITTCGDGRNGHLMLVTSDHYLKKFEAGYSTAAILPLELAPAAKSGIQVPNPEIAFEKIVQLFRPSVSRTNRSISPLATISPTAQIGSNVCIHPGAVILDGVSIGDGTTVFPNVTIMENCHIGQDVTIYPGAVLYENTLVGHRVILQANVVLGGLGFGYRFQDGRHQMGPQLGNVIIEEDVEIGANTTIDRGTYDSTVIGRGSKLDNLVMVGHNCKIGQDNLLCSQVGIAGSCETGSHVIMGGQVGLADHLKLGDRVRIGAQSGLMHDVATDQQVFGSPARPLKEEMQFQANRPRIPEMRKQVRELAKLVAVLQQQVQSLTPVADSTTEMTTSGNVPATAPAAESLTSGPCHKMVDQPVEVETLSTSVSVPQTYAA